MEMNTYKMNVLMGRFYIYVQIATCQQRSPKVPSLICLLEEEEVAERMEKEHERRQRSVKGT